MTKAEIEKLADELDLSWCDPRWYDEAKKAFLEGDAGGFLFCTKDGNQYRFDFARDNFEPLHKRGMWESVVFEAYPSCRANWLAWSRADLLFFFFLVCDLEKLRALGDPLPGEGPFTIYRGVAGVGRRRRVRGLSWTASLPQACWFALRFSLEDPAIFQTTVEIPDVFFYSDGRNEQEFVCDVKKKPKRLKLSPDEMKAEAAKRKPNEEYS